jgi:hypothetical protein
LEAEHLLPRSRFPFDAYLNLVPACRQCNQEKGGRTPAEAGKSIHPDAYQAYCNYVATKKVKGFSLRHPYHDTKKGLLNRMQPGRRALEAEEALAMILADFAHVEKTQRACRPLGRWLAEKIESFSKRPCALRAQSGRLTALYRSIMLPGYAKDHQDPYNHAIDAAVLACKLPAVGTLAGGRWVSIQQTHGWFERVLLAAPALTDGRPFAQLPKSFRPLEGFERLLPGGYLDLELSSFNWNRKHQGICGLDPAGPHLAGGRDTRSIAASTIYLGKAGTGGFKGLKALIEAQDLAGADGLIEKFCLQGLRDYCRADLLHADVRFLEYLRRSIHTEGMGDHPADVIRAARESAFARGETDEIPPFVTVRWSVSGGGFSVTRVDAQGQTIGRFQASPGLRWMLVGYRAKKGATDGIEEIDESKPKLFGINQIYQVKDKHLAKDVPAESLLRIGRPLGSAEPEEDFLRRWWAAWKHYCQDHGIARYVRLTQGCVIQRRDGTQFYVRNFDLSKEGLQCKSLTGIVHVWRTPLQAIAAQVAWTPRVLVRRQQNEPVGVERRANQDRRVA